MNSLLELFMCDMRGSKSLWVYVLGDIGEVRLGWLGGKRLASEFWFCICFVFKDMSLGFDSKVGGRPALV